MNKKIHKLHLHERFFVIVAIVV